MQLSSKGNAVSMEVSFWLHEEDNSIRMSAPGVPGFTLGKISADSERRNGHPTLFNRLAKCLADMKATAPKMIEDEDASAPRDANQLAKIINLPNNGPIF